LAIVSRFRSIADCINSKWAMRQQDDSTLSTSCCFGCTSLTQIQSFVVRTFYNSGIRQIWGLEHKHDAPVMVLCFACETFMTANLIMKKELPQKPYIATCCFEVIFIIHQTLIWSYNRRTWVSWWLKIMYTCDFFK
jgi:hypothetical protein